VVIETAMVCMPDPVRGEVLGIFVVPKMGAKITEEEVVQHIRKTIGAVVGRVIIANMLPKTRTGKMMRRVLRAFASG
jgi:4-hydroxybutyrate---CoA ligase (AMP-forming)